MTWLLDTNVVSEISRPLPDSQCMAWLEAHAEDCVISTITLAELRYGLKDCRQEKERPKRIGRFNFWWRIFRAVSLISTQPPPPNGAVMRRNWKIYKVRIGGKHFDLRDTQIAAIAREYGLIVATRNTKDFPLCPTENPFQVRD